MEPWSLAGLIAELKKVLATIYSAVRGLFRSGRPKPHAVGLTHFGEYERIEESKYYPPAAPDLLKIAEGELPDLYGRTRLVMLVVNPYLVHAYWEVRPDELAAAQQSTVNKPAEVVLRFYELKPGAPADEPPVGSFDVDVDLHARNRFIDLWSADKTYYAELGLRRSDGSLVRLTRSNPVRTPRASPVAKGEEIFMRLEPARQLAETVAPPKRMTPPFTEAMALPERSPAIAISAVDLAATLPVGSVSPLTAGYSGPADSEQVLTRKLADLYALRRASDEPSVGGVAAGGPGAPVAVEAEGAPSPGVVPGLTDSHEASRRKPADLYTIRSSSEQPLQAAEREVLLAPGLEIERPRTDLTEMAERLFDSSMSSPVARRDRAES